MRKQLLSVTVPLVLIGSMGPALAEEPCSVATLSGTYIFSALGVAGDAVSAYAGMISYDGRGAYKIRMHFAGPSEKTRQDSGVYSPSGNCEFEAVSQSGRSAVYFVNPSGDGFKFVLRDGGNAVGAAERVTRALLVE